MNFRTIIDQYDRKIPFVIITHGHCADGAFALHIAQKGLIDMGFTISLCINYFHNTDNFTQHLSVFFN